MVTEYFLKLLLSSHVENFFQTEHFFQSGFFSNLDFFPIFQHFKETAFQIKAIYWG